MLCIAEELQCMALVGAHTSLVGMREQARLILVQGEHAAATGCIAFTRVRSALRRALRLCGATQEALQPCLFGWQWQRRSK